MTKKELNKIVTTELRKFGIDKATLDVAFEYSYEKNRVHYCIKKSFDDDYFDAFLKDRFDFDDFAPFTLSLLHEVGHYKNNDDIIDDVYAFCLGEKYKIQSDIMDTEDDARLKNLYYRYFSLPDEIMATAWAINYAKSHSKEVKDLEKKFTNAIKKYIKDNGFN